MTSLMILVLITCLSLSLHKKGIYTFLNYRFSIMIYHYTSLLKITILMAFLLWLSGAGGIKKQSSCVSTTAQRLVFVSLDAMIIPRLQLFLTWLFLFKVSTKLRVSIWGDHQRHMWDLLKILLSRPQCNLNSWGKIWALAVCFCFLTLQDILIYGQYVQGLSSILSVTVQADLLSFHLQHS